MIGSPTRPSPSSAPLVGREEIVGEVARLLTQARDGHGQGLILVGARGMGKSHLLQALSDRASRGEFRVLAGRALPDELPAPFSLVRQLLGAGDGEAAVLAKGAAPGTPVAWPLPSSVEPFPGRTETTPESPGLRTLLDDFDRVLAPLVERGVAGLETSREELLGHLEEYFLALTRDRPLLLAIDDLHLADTSSLDFLWRFSLDLPKTPAVVVATVSMGDAVPERTRASLELLTRSPSFRSAVLQPLTFPEVTELVGWIIGGRTPDPQDVLRWYTQTEGNPLFVEQLVRSATGFRPAGQQLSQVPRQSLADVLASRVQALRPDERRVLAYATVLGEEFGFAELQAVTSLGEERVSESVDRLVQEGFLREKGHEVYAFVTETVRVGVYADLTETHRRILHQKAGLVLEAKGGVRDADLARHFYLGHDNERAVKYNITAAQNATRDFAFETAATLVARALESERRRADRDVTTEIRLLTEEGRLLTEAGNPHRSDVLLSEALALARTHPGHDLELGRALLGLAWCRYERGRYSDAESLAAEAADYFPRVGTTRDLMALHRVSGEAYWRRGNFERAEPHFRAALELAEKEGTPLEQGHALIDMANFVVPSDPEKLRTVLDLYTRAADLFSKLQDHVALARVLMDRGWAEWEAGQVEPSFRDLRLAIEESERAHSSRWIVWCEFNLAQMQVEVGEVAPARASLERAVQASSPGEDLYAEQQIMMTRGMIDHAAQFFDAAETDYQDSLALARRLNVPADVSEVLLRLAQLSHDRGDDARARERLAEARASGVLEYHPNLGPRMAALERSLGGATASESGAQRS